jgi:hypothetical protein
LEHGVVSDRFASRLGGAALVAGSMGFVAVFSYLASTFGYPDVLDEPASEVLPALAAGGSSLRAAWLLYAAIPLTLLVGGLASMPLLERGGGRTLARFGGGVAVIASVSMMLGLLRWPSIQWALAERWIGSSAGQREVYATIFDGANVYLGNMIGEYLGETMLGGWFIAMGIALRGVQRSWVGNASIVMGIVVVVSAQRQLTHLVDPMADLDNVLLPVWLVVLGIVLWRDVSTQRSRSEMPLVSVPSIA